MNDNVLRYVKRVFNVITILGFVATIVGGVYLWRLGAFQNQAVALHLRAYFEHAAYKNVLSLTCIAHTDMGLSRNQQCIPRVVGIYLEGKR